LFGQGKMGPRGGGEVVFVEGFALPPKGGGDKARPKEEVHERSSCGPLGLGGPRLAPSAEGPKAGWGGGTQFNLVVWGGPKDEVRGRGERSGAGPPRGKGTNQEKGKREQEEGGARWGGPVNRGVGPGEDHHPMERGGPR